MSERQETFEQAAMSLIRVALLVFLVFGPILGLQADHLKTMDEVKWWHFETSDHSVEMTLSSYASMGKPSNTVLSFQSSRGEGTTHELAQFLGSALKEMPSLGYDSSKIIMISTGLEGSERQAVNRVVERSGVLASCFKRKYCPQAQAVADQYLVSTGAYSELDQVLRLYGLHKTRVFTDEMGCGLRANKTTSSPAKVWCHGVVHIVVEKAD